MRLWLVIVLAALVLACPLAQATAAEGSADHKQKGDDVFRGTLDLALWTIVVFLVLLFVLRSTAWRPLLEGLDKREQNIAGAMEEARAAREEAARLNERLRAEMDKAAEQVRQMMDEARRNAERLAADLIAQGEAKLQADRESLNREVATSYDQALQQVFSQGVDLGTLIASKVVGRQLNADDHRRLLDEALAEFRKAGEARLADIESVRA
jgi:F-type H+-transporting ATPase subunit b